MIRRSFRNILCLGYLINILYVTVIIINVLGSASTVLRVLINWCNNSCKYWYNTMGMSYYIENKNFRPLNFVSV